MALGSKFHIKAESEVQIVQFRRPQAKKSEKRIQNILCPNNPKDLLKNLCFNLFNLFFWVFGSMLGVFFWGVSGYLFGGRLEAFCMHFCLILEGFQGVNIRETYRKQKRINKHIVSGPKKRENIQFWGCFGDMFIQFWRCFGDIFIQFWRCFGNMFIQFWRCFGDMFIQFWKCFGDIFIQFWRYFGDVF